MAQNSVTQLQSELQTLNLQDSLNTILEKEKRYRGVDWKAFYSGQQQEYASVTRVLQSLGLKGEAEMLQKDPAAFLAA